VRRIDIDDEHETVRLDRPDDVDRFLGASRFQRCRDALIPAKFGHDVPLVTGWMTLAAYGNQLSTPRRAWLFASEHSGYQMTTRWSGARYI